MNVEWPYASIRRAGRWTYLVQIRHGFMTYGPDGYGWIVLGEKRARRKARRELDRYNRNEARRAQVEIVEAGS
jgi:hypothetical protein